MDRGGLADASIRDLKEDIKVAQERKKYLEDYLKRLQEAHKRGKISKSSYLETLYLHRDGRSIQGWIEHYEYLIKEYKKEIKKRKKTRIKSHFFISIFLALVVVSLFLFLKSPIQPQITGFASFNPSDNRSIGYEFLDSNGSIVNAAEGIYVHTWNTKHDYFFNKSSGIQFTNNFQDYWTRNVFCAGYKNASEEWLYDCNDVLPFTWSIDTDNTTYVNITGWRDKTIAGRTVRLALRYHLKTDDENLTIQFSVKHLSGADIPNDLGFAWRVTDIKIGGDEANDKILINDTEYWLNETIDVNFTDEGYYRLFDSNTLNYLWLDWNENLSEILEIKNKTGQYNAPVTLAINAGPLSVGQEKTTEMFWLDARTLTSVSMTANDTSINEVDSITVTGVYDAPGSGGAGSWVFGLNDTANKQTINATCYGNAAFRVTATDTSGCAGAGESCSADSNGVITASLKSTGHTIVWTLQACVPINSPSNITTYDAGSSSAVSFTHSTGNITISPVYAWFSNPQVNDSEIFAGDTVNHSMDITNSPYGYIFSWNGTNDCTGGWSNSSFIDTSGSSSTTAWNVSTTGTGCGGETIFWKFYANNSLGWNSSEDQTYLNYKYGYLEVSISDPANDSYNYTNDLINLKANVTCGGGAGVKCGNIGASARYNVSSGNPDTLINKTKGATPFYIQEGGKNGWNLSTATDDGEGFTHTESAVEGIFFKSDGTKLYELGTTNSLIYQSTCSDPWNVSSCSYDNVNVSIQGSLSTGVGFKPDGTKLYEFGRDTIYQYTCTDAWNLSSCSYDSVSVPITDDSVMEGVFFKPDGTRFYAVGSGADAFYQYSCTDAWNLSSCSYDTVSISTQDATPNGVFFRPDGKKLYEAGFTDDFIYQYSCTDAWNLSSCSYDSVSVATTSLNPTDLFFKPDGTKLYEACDSGGTIHESSLDLEIENPQISFLDTNNLEYGEYEFFNWTLNVTSTSIESYLLDIDFNSSYGSASVPDNNTEDRKITLNKYGWLNVTWSSFSDLNDTCTSGSPCNYTQNDSFNISAVIACEGGTGIKCGSVSASARYNASSGNPDTLISVTQGATPFYATKGGGQGWNLSTASYDNVNISTVEIGNTEGLFFKPDGTKLYEVGSSFDIISQSICTDAWNLSSCTNNDANLSTGTGTVVGLYFKPDGTKLYEMDQSLGTIDEYTCTDPWNVSSCSTSGVTIDTLDALAPEDLFFKPDGTRLYEVGSTSDFIYQRTCTTPWDLSSCSTTGTNILTDTTPAGIFFNPDGVKLYEAGYDAVVVYEHPCATPWSVTSCSYDNVNISVPDIRITGVSFKPDGLKMYVVGSGNDLVYQFSLQEEILNPQIYYTNLTNGEPYIVNWTVNFTGTGTYEIDINVTSDQVGSVSDNSSTDAVVTTEAGAGNSPPTIPYVEPIPATDPTIGTITSITFNFTATDTDGVDNIDNSTAAAYFNRTGEPTRSNSSCEARNASGNSITFTCTIDMWYFDENGDWTINATIQDTSSAWGINDTTTFTYNLQTAMTMAPTSLTWPEVGLASTDTGSDTDPIVINNSGNAVDLSINVTAYDLEGDEIKTDYIYAGNFTVGNAGEGCSGTTMTNATSINVTSAILQRGNNTLDFKNATSGQEEIFFCLKELPSGISQQSYSSAAFGPWEVRILLVLVIPRSRRRKKKKQRSRKYVLDGLTIPTTIFSKDLGSLEALVKYLKENKDLNYKIIADLLNRDQRTIWNVYQKAIKKQPKEIETGENYELIPIEALKNRKLTTLESSIVYMKDNRMKYSEIAKLLDRDQRNVRAIYLRATEKIEEEELKELVRIKIEINIPAGIFSEKLGALESLVKYMKENLKMSYKAIAEELGRDERTIWTAYQKAREKQSEKIRVKETGIILPISIFKRLTIITSIIIYLKNKGLRYSEIAEILNRNQRNIWTIYSRAKNKRLT